MEFTGIFIPVKYLDADDLTLREKAFLGYVGIEDNIQIAALAEWLLDTDKAKVLKIMDDLENKGYIEARPSPNMSAGWYRIRSLK
ncbi:MarR family transcriptional regulator [Megasphaera sp.]|jgi:DNA-binding MarR family transcriptional regulator|uniref:MarR family transcriptional regulator n=1 Tax=Megasphaera sp. TaxID=2023260 RepID=UPI00258A9147|nr:helix-turn-helix domain-containing protein [uncultured Megasphaera sp.]